jgi:hypothetical protein
VTRWLSAVAIGRPRRGGLLPAIGSTRTTQFLWRRISCREPARSSLSSTEPARPSLPSAPVVPAGLLSRSECSERTLALAVVLTPNSLDLGEDRLARADMLRLGAAKILDKRPGPSGDEYKCEFEPEWLAADLLEKTQMGRVHMRTYEKNVTRARRVRTLRSGKAKP